MYKVEKRKEKTRKFKKRRKSTKKDLIYSMRKTKTDIDYINLKNKHEQAYNGII